MSEEQERCEMGVRRNKQHRGRNRRLLIRDRVERERERERERETRCQRPYPPTPRQRAPPRRRECVPSHLIPVGWFFCSIWGKERKSLNKGARRCCCVAAAQRPGQCGYTARLGTVWDYRMQFCPPTHICCIHCNSTVH